MPSERYQWVALSNTTLGMLLATVNSSIVIISLPAIFRGIRLNPLEPGNVGYNPIQNLLAPFHVLGGLAPDDRATLTGRSCFPHLISEPFHHGLVIVFSMAIAMSLVWPASHGRSSPIRRGPAARNVAGSRSGSTARGQTRQDWTRASSVVWS